MALTLKLASHANLPGGGPVFYSLGEEGSFDIGRDQTADWRLPDTERIVSSRHCQIRRQNGDYLLIDFSTNGTFVNGATSRVQSPYRLKDGDRLQIGEYHISVAISQDASREAVAPAPVKLDRPESAKSLWDFAGDVAPPSDPRDLKPKGRAIPVHGDFLSYNFDPPHVSEAAQFTPAASALPAPPVVAPEPARAPEPRRRAAPSSNIWGAPADSFSPETAPIEAAPAVEPPLPPMEIAPPAPVAPPPPPVPVASPPLAAPAPVAPAQSGSGDEAFLRGFMSACGLDARLPAMDHPEEFGAQLGRFALAVIGEMQLLLRARGEAKMAARTREFTMIQPQDNNPLKFTPTPEEALRIMFGRPSRTYLDAARAIDSGFNDLKHHQVQTFSAMQQALRDLLAEFDPARIEAKIEKPQGAGALFTHRKSQLWDAYVAAWRAQAASHPDGVVGRFMTLFGNFYDRAGAE
jgi:type VI secretion system protein ImpI